MTTVKLEEAETIATRFFNRYADCLDSGRHSEWPGFFRQTDCRYEIRSRENEDLNLPAAIMYCDTHGMLMDRVTMLAKALTYRHLIHRHFISNVFVSSVSTDEIQVKANYQLMQTDNDGVTSLFGVGQYLLTLVPEDDQWLASQLLVIVDTFGIDNMLAVPT